MTAEDDYLVVHIYENLPGFSVAAAAGFQNTPNMSGRDIANLSIVGAGAAEYLHVGSYAERHVNDTYTIHNRYVSDI